MIPKGPALVSWHQRQLLPVCPRGSVRAALNRAGTYARRGLGHLARGSCRRAYDDLWAAQRAYDSVACYTGGIPHEESRRLAQRAAHVRERVLDLHFGIASDCLVGGGKRSR